MNIIKKMRKKVFFLLKTNGKKSKVFTNANELKRLSSQLNTQVNDSHFTQALISIKKIVALDPKNSEFQIKLIQLLQKNNFLTEAYKVIKTNQKNKFSHYYEFQLAEANLLYKLKNYKKALSIYTHLYNVFPSKTELKTKISSIYNKIPDTFMAPLADQLKKMKNNTVLLQKKKINTKKLQNILFKQENLR